MRTSGLNVYLKNISSWLDPLTNCISSLTALLLLQRGVNILTVPLSHGTKWTLLEFSLQ